MMRVNRLARVVVHAQVSRPIASRVQNAHQISYHPAVITYRNCSSNATKEAAEDAKASEATEATEATEASEAFEASEETTEIDEVELRTKECDELKDQLAEAKDKVLRAYAEMENVRTIAKRDVQNSKDFAVQSFAKSLLDVADNMARATDSVPKEGRSDELNTLLEGVIMTQKQLLKTFESQGIKPFGEEGEKFDPNFHEAMFEFVDPSKEVGSVGQVIKTGYTLHGRVIRPAQVGTVKDA